MGKGLMQWQKTRQYASQEGTFVRTSRIVAYSTSQVNVVGFVLQVMLCICVSLDAELDCNGGTRKGSEFTNEFANIDRR